MVQESSTFDETHYFGLGKYLLQTGRWDVPGSILHPPLSYYLHSVPLLFVSTDDTLWKQDPRWHRNPHYRTILDIERGRAILSSPANDGDRLLTLARLMMVLVALLLGWYVFSWSFALYGNSGAVIAVVLYSFCPNILAHARLITPDIALTTFFFATVYYFWRMLREDRLSVAIVAGIALGLALLSKYTAVLLVPLCVVLALFWFFQTKSLPWRGCLIFGAVGLAVFLLGYRGNLEPYFAGLQYQREYVSRPQWVFLCGECLPCRWGCYFYTTSFLLKTPIAAMIGLVVAIWVFVKKAVRGEWISETFLLAPALAIFALFAVHAQCRGLRYLLPMYPFLFVFIAGGITYLLSRKIVAILCGGLALWYLGASLYIHPHYLAYFNELVGGPENGYKYFVDCDLDWGQDLKGLGRYMREHHIPKVLLSYSGSDSPQRYGIAYEPLPGCTLLEPPRDQKEAPEITVPAYVAVSATHLQGASLPDIDMYAALRNREPVAKIGYSIFIYPNVDIDLDDSGRLDKAIAHYRKALEIRPDFAAAHCNLGLIFTRLGRLDEAITEYRKAVEIKPDFAEAHNNLGLILARLGRLDEAITEYRKAVEIKPYFAEAHYSLGLALAARGQVDEAMSHYQKALAIKPDYAEAHYRLGLALAARGQVDGAMSHHQKALAIKPDYAEAHYRLGLALAARGQLDEAMSRYQKALAINPGYAEPRNNLGTILAGRGKIDEAIDCFRKALEIEPDFADAHYNLGLALAGRGQIEEAIEHYRQTLKVKPDHEEALNNLAWLRATCPEASFRDGAEAVKWAQRLMELSGDRDANVLDTLAAAYAEAGRFSEAVQTAQSLATGHRTEQAAVGGIDQGQDCPVRSANALSRDATIDRPAFRPPLAAGRTPN